jgi:hypothetical protein
MLPCDSRMPWSARLTSILNKPNEAVDIKGEISGRPVPRAWPDCWPVTERGEGSFRLFRHSLRAIPGHPDFDRELRCRYATRRLLRGHHYSVGAGKPQQLLAEKVSNHLIGQRREGVQSRIPEVPLHG